MSLMRRCFRILLAVPFFLAGMAYGLAIDFFDAGTEAAQRDKNVPPCPVPRKKPAI